MIAATPSLAGETTTYTYDDLGRLTGVSSSGTINDGVNTSYQYDDADNRANVTVTGATSAGVTFSIDSVSVNEAGTASFTITKSGTASGTLSVDYATANGTATAGSDYTAASGGVSFATADTTKTVNVVTSADTLVEGNETFTVTLSNPATGATIAPGGGTGTGMIVDDDATTFAISNATAVVEGGNLVYTVSKTGPAAANIAYSPTGSATSGSDYSASTASGTLTFGAGNSLQTVTVVTLDDSAPESSETVLINLSSPTNGATISDNQGSGTIQDNDVEPTSFAISVGPAATEGNSLQITVTKIGGVAASVTVSPTGGTATAGSDYVNVPAVTLNFTSSETSKTLNLATVDDSVIEDAETVILTLSSPTNGATITAGSATGTINDNDAGVAVADAQTIEGSALQFVLTRSGAGGQFSVSYATSNGSAAAGSDYTSTSGSVDFPLGVTSQTISVPTAFDSANESAETVNFTLSAPSGASIVDGTAVGTINNNVSGSIFSIADGEAEEGDPIPLVITRSGVTTHSSTVQLTPASGTATLGVDTSVNGPRDVDFSAGQTSRTVNVPTNNDGINESDETLTITLTTLTAGDSVADDTAVGTIIDDD